MDTLFGKRINLLIFYLTGAAAASLCLFTRPLYALVLIAAVFVLVFTFVQLEISLCAFTFLMCVIPHEYWSNYYILFAAVFYSLVYALLYAAGKRPGINLKRLYPSLVFFIAFSCVSLFVGSDMQDGLKMLAILISCAVFFVLLQNLINDRKKLYIAFVFLLTGVFLSALYGLYQFVGGIEIRADYVDIAVNTDMPGRVFSTMDNPNIYAGFLCMLIPPCMGFILNQKSDAKKLFFALMLASALLALVLTFSRASYIVIIAAVCLFILMTGRRLIPVLILLGIAAIPFLPSVIINRIMTIGQDSSSKMRLDIWTGVFDILKERWLMGIGLGPAEFVKAYKAVALPEAMSALHSHNTFLQIWLETGIGGILAFLAYTLKLVTSSFNAYFASKDKYMRNILAGCVSGICAFAAFSFVDNLWSYARTNLTFWIVCGLTAAVIGINMAEQKTQN